VIMLSAGVVIVPFLWLGIPSGHDFEFHLNSWMEVANQWRHGVIYPHWAAAAQYGHGEPRFIFYPPASWMLGAALGTLLPWLAVPATYLWIALTLSGCSMFVLARRWFRRWDALFAAALYTANPYFIVLVYWRSAYAELLAGALMPLLLLYVLRAPEEGRRVIPPLGLIVAAAWLTNAPAATMLCYSVVVLSVVVAITQRSARILMFSMGAILLGGALAAFFLVPAAYEQKWVNIASAGSGAAPPGQLSLYNHRRSGSQPIQFPGFSGSDGGDCCGRAGGGAVAQAAKGWFSALVVHGDLGRRGWRDDVSVRGIFLAVHP